MTAAALDRVLTIPTPREKEILCLLLLGYENEDMSKELHMSKRTVKAHFNRMYLRYGISSGIKRVKMAIIAYHHRVEWNLEPKE